MNTQNEFEGKTVEEATEAGLKALGLAENEAEIEVVNRGNRGIFGIGSTTAVVRITPLSAQAISAKAASATQADVANDNTSADDTSANAVASSSVQSSAPSANSDTVESADTSPTQESTTVENVAEENIAAGGSAADGEESSDESYDEEEISDDELADMAMDMLGKTVSLMGYDVEITARWKDPEPGDDERCLTLDVEGDNLGPLIGRRGETLDNLQYMLRLMVNQKIRSWCNIVVDVASYKSRRAEQLVQMANRVAEQVVESGRPQSMEPMPSNERRIVHLTLRDHADVYTESTGDSDRRKVHVVPKSLTS